MAINKRFIDELLHLQSWIQTLTLSNFPQQGFTDSLFNRRAFIKHEKRFYKCKGGGYEDLALLRSLKAGFQGVRVCTRTGLSAACSQIKQNAQTRKL